MPTLRTLQIRKGIAKGVVLLFYTAIFHIFVNTSSGSIEKYLSTPPHRYLKQLASSVSWLPDENQNLWHVILFVTLLINAFVLLTWVITQVIFLLLCMEILTKRRWALVSDLLRDTFCK